MLGAEAILGSSVSKFGPYETSFAIHDIVVHILHFMDACSGKSEKVVIVRPQECNHKIVELLNTLIS